MALDMLAAKHRASKPHASKDNGVPKSDTASAVNSDGAGSNDRNSDNENVAIYPLSIPLRAALRRSCRSLSSKLISPAAFGGMVIVYTALIATGMIHGAAVITET